MLNDSSGQSRISTLIYILVAILVIYVVIKLVPPYMRYYAMDDEVHQQLQMSKINDVKTIRYDLIDKARELDIPLDPDYMELTTEGGHLRIYVAWVEEVDFGYGITRDLEFAIDTAPVESE